VLDFDGEVDVHGDRLVIEDGGAPAGLADCLDDPSIQGGIERLNDFNVGGATGFVDVELEDHLGRVRERAEVRGVGEVNCDWGAELSERNSSGDRARG
jgi:hypothetical protein